MAGFGSPALITLMGLFAVSAGLFRSGALDRLRELIASDSTDAQAFNNYAYSLVERGEDVEFALELAKTAIRLSPKSAPYLDTIGWIYFKMNRFDEAMKYIRESLNIDQDNATIQEHMDEVIKAKSNQAIPKIQQVEKQN